MKGSTCEQDTGRIVSLPDGRLPLAIRMTIQILLYVLAAILIVIGSIAAERAVVCVGMILTARVSRV